MGKLSLRNVFVRGNTSSSRIIPAPVADFNASAVSGVFPLTVTFTDISTNTPTSWAWDFNNDGTVDSTTQNPSYTYNTPGTYAVKLTATNATGSGEVTKTGFITVLSPVYTLSRSAVEVNEGASITITLSTQYVEVGTIVPYTISGTGITTADINGASLTGTFVVSGTFNSGTSSVTLNVTADTLTEGAETITLSIEPQSQTVSVVVNDTSITPVAIVQSNTMLTSLLLKSSAVEGANTLGFEDASSNNFAITRNGNATETSLSPFNPSGWSTYFDGNGDYLSTPFSSSLNLSTTNFTIEFWLYNISGSYTLGRASAYTGVHLQMDSATTMNLYSSTNGSSWNLANGISIGTITRNEWCHVVVVRSGANLCGFVNGKLGAVINVSTNALSMGTSDWRIGTGHNTSYTLGYISNVRIVRDAVYDPMIPQFKVPTAPLTDIPGTVLLACNSANQVDSSPSRATITVNGDAAIKAFSPFKAYDATENSLVGGSVYFDGSGDYLNAGSNAAYAFGTGDFTIEGWVNFNTLTNSGIFQIGGSLFPLVNGIGLGLNASSPPSWMLYAQNGGQTVTTIKPAANTWYHFAVVRASSITKLYINGSETSISFNDTTNYTGTFLGIGAIYSTSYVMNGYVSNFRIVKGTALYTANFAPSTTALTAVTGTSLLTCQSSPIRDASSNNFTITTVGDARYSVMGPFRSISSGSSVYFDGTGDYLTVPSNSAFTLGSTDDFTIECWVNSAAQVNAYTGIVTTFTDFNNSSGYTNRWFLGITNNANGNKIRWYDSTGNGFVDSASTLPLNTWTHISVVRRSGTTTLYVNGVSQGTQTTNQSYTTQSSLTIGYVGSGGAFNGYISNLRIVKGTALYTANFTPSTSSLTAVSGTSLLTCQSSSIRDNSTNNLTITRNGDARVVNAGPFMSTASDSYTFADPTAGGSVYFDGNGDFLSSTITSTAIGTSDFSVECWVYPTAAYGTLSRMFKFGPTGTAGFLTFYINTNGQLIYGRAGTDIVTSTGTIPLNSWTHIAISRQSGTARVYLNGVLSGSASDSTNFPATTVFYLGSDGGTNYFTGYISNFRLVNGTALYTTSFTPSTSLLTAVAGTVVLTCQSGVIVDASSNNFRISVSGNTTVSALGPFTANVVSGSAYTPANPAGSVYFGGSVSIPDNEAFNFGTGNFTVECWVNFNSVTGTQWFFTQWQSSSQLDTTSAFYIILASSKISAGIAYNNSISQFSLSSTTSMAVGQWYHVALVRNGANTTLYINGIAEASNTTLGSMAVNNSTVPVLLGMRQGSVNYLNGFISNARIVKGTAVYSSNFTPSTLPLTAVSGTSLLTCQGLGFKDASTNNFTVTPGNSEAKPVGVTPFDVPALGKSVYFDGTGDYLSFSSLADSQAIFGGAGAFTFEAWVYPLSSSWTLVDNVNTSANAAWWSISHTAADGMVLSFGLWGSSSANAKTGNSQNVPINKWTHIVVQRRADNTIDIYFDGISKTVTNGFYGGYVGYNLTSGAIAKIGTNSTTGAMYISNFRFTKNQQVYNSNFTPSTSPLTAVTGTSLLTCQSAAIVDNSTNAFAITRNGDARSSDFTPFTLPAKSTYAGSVYFDGTGDFLTIPGSNAFALSTSTTSFTIEAWVYPTAAGGAIFSEQFTSGSNTVAIAISLGDGSSIVNTGGLTPAIGWYTGSAWVSAAISNSAVPINSWTHVAAVFTGSTTRIYLNGVDTTKTSSPTPATTWGIVGANGDNWYIGKRWDNSPTEFFRGYISNLRFVKGSAVYTSSFVPSTGPLAAIPGTVLLLDNASPGIYDATQKLAMETANTAANIKTSTSIKKFNSSVYFNGTSSSMLTLPTSPEMNVSNGAFTIEFWFYNTHTTWNKAMDFTDGASGALAIYVGSDGTLRYAPQMSTSRSLGSISSLALNTWHHFAIVKSNNQMVAYVNGVALSAPVADTQTFGAITRIGGSTDGYIIGYMEDFRVVKGQAVYTSTFTPPTATLTV